MKVIYANAKASRHKLPEQLSLQQQVRWLERCWVVFWQQQLAKTTADQAPPGSVL